jgi:hypothetical protein
MRLLIALVATAPAVAGGLEVQRLGSDRVRIAWPSSPPAALEERESLGVDESWRSFTGTVVVSGGVHAVEVVPTGRERYFRLRALPARELTRPAEISPAPGETGVAVTRETLVRSMPPSADAASCPAPNSRPTGRRPGCFFSRISPAPRA